jgi:hypothetical protein
MKLFFLNPASLLTMAIMVQTLFAQEPIKFDPVQAEQFLNSPTPAPQPPPAAAPPPAAVPQPAPVAQPTPPPAPAPVASVAVKMTYEEFLDNIEALAKSVMPEKKRLDSLKAIENAETPAPKDEYEKQVDYEKRSADFENAKQQKLQSLDAEYKERTKEPTEKIKQGITSKDDWQPAWAGMLNQEASNVKEYSERSAKTSVKISEMKARISSVSELLGALNFSQSEIKLITERWQQKNQLYISRLKRAMELMQDYSLQEQAKILTTDKKKVNMTLGAYNAENEVFEVSINDSASHVVPFNFSGAIKMPPEQARETNKQTDNFTVSVDYINYPFIINNSANTFPGAKQIYVYYKDNELQSKGNFVDVLRLSKNNSYAQWKVYADSLISGKLAPKNLDSTYAMNLKGFDFSEDDKSEKRAQAANDASSSGGSFWTTRNKVRVAVFAVSALCLGLGISKDGDVSKNKKETNRLNAELGYNPNRDSEEFKKYTKSKNELESSESSRNAYYLGAAVFGIAGAATFFF